MPNSFIRCGKKELKVQRQKDQLTCGDVDKPDSTISCINMLPTCSFGSKCIYSQVLRVYFHIYLEPEVWHE